MSSNGLDIKNAIYFDQAWQKLRALPYIDFLVALFASNSVEHHFNVTSFLDSFNGLALFVKSCFQLM